MGKRQERWYDPLGTPERLMPLVLTEIPGPVFYMESGGSKRDSNLVVIVA